MDKGIKSRKLKNRLFRWLVVALAFACCVPLFFIVFYILQKGLGALSWAFFTNVAKPVGEPGGGIADALVGTLLLVFMAVLFAAPVGVLAGVYLAENQGKRLTNSIRTAAEVLQGIPSIVLGIIAYLWLVKPLSTFSALSGSVALAFMMLPMIVRSTEEAIKLVPAGLKEASLALGVPYYKTMVRVVVPAGFSGIITGVMLGVSRIAGETAPLLFTAFGNTFINLNPLKPVNALPLLIFNYAASPYPAWHELAWGAALVLLIIVLTLNLLAKKLARRWKTQF